MFPMIFFISFGICSTPKLSKYVTINEFLLIYTHQNSFHIPPTPFFILGKLSLEKTSLNLGSF